MALEFYLVPNVITPDPNDYMAITLSGDTMTLEHLFDDVTHEGSTVTKAEGLAFYEEMCKSITKALIRGQSINTPLFNIRATIVGVFNSEDDAFAPSRHVVKIRITPGVRLRELEGKIPVKKVKATERLPILLHYYDNNTESQDEVATSLGGAKITGSLLKFDEADATQGIFFINTATAAEVKVGGKLLRNKPGELIFMNPTLPAGSYKIEVRTLLQNTAGLKKGTLSDVITVS